MTSTRSRRAAGLLLALALAAPAGAESLLELLPPGEPLLPFDAHAIALGGAAEARWDLESGLPANPAQLVAIDGVSFATVLQMRRGLRELPSGADWDETRQDFPAFQISAALPRGLRLGVGYRGDLRSRGAFSLQVPFDLDAVDHYALRYVQDGSLARFPISFAFALAERYRLGLGLNLYRGSLNQEWLYDFPSATGGDPDLGYQDRKVRREGSWRGTGLALGLQAQPFGPATTLSLRLDSGADLKGSSRIETAGEAAVSEAAVAGELPLRWALGLARRLPRGTLVSLQWDHEQWSDYRAPLGAVPLRDVDRLALGLELLWSEVPPASRPQRRLPLRLGLRVGDWPGPDAFTGAAIRETLLSAGTGIDLQSGRGSLDLTVFWQRLAIGDATSERRLGVALSLRTSETWTRRSQPF
ncbi:hypothetical protein FJ251_10400 [bacterium]|nr:hypothetical protein [bacterium]